MNARGARGGKRAGRLAGALAWSATLLLAGLPAGGHAAEPAATPAFAGAVPEGALEAIHGVRVDQVAVTAGGGLVDLRFTILDPVKARPLLGGGHAALPRLIVEGSGVELQAPRHGAMRGVRLQKDAASFLLYPNTRNAVRPGARVAVAFGDVTVEPVVAK